MIRDQETFNILLDTIRRFVRERLIPAEQQVAESDEDQPAVRDYCRADGAVGPSPILDDELLAQSFR